MGETAAGARSSERKQHHLFCEISICGKSFSAAILNLSEAGLFVRTSVDPAPGTAAQITL